MVSKYSIPSFISHISKATSIHILTHLVTTDLIQIGEGAQGQVYESTMNIFEKEHRVAIKKIFIPKDSEETFKYLEIELQCLDKFKYQGLPNLLAVYYDPDLNENFIYLIFELIRGKVLSDIYFKEVKSKDRIEILINLCDIISYLHSNKVIHRDIKPNNIIIQEGTNQVFLIDFGVSKICKHTITFTANDMGTTRYMPPENYQFDIETKDDRYIQISPKFDIWSLGCLIFQVLTGEIPWHNISSGEAVGAKLMNLAEFPLPDAVKKNMLIYNLIRSCTNNDPSLRPEATQVKQALIEILDKKARKGS